MSYIKRQLEEDNMKDKQLLIGLSGYAQSGKDTVADYLREHHDFIRVSFADQIKQALYVLNPMIAHDARVDYLQTYLMNSSWDEMKQNKEVRRLLQRLGTQVGRNFIDENIWLDRVFKSKLFDSTASIVITDVRFENEADEIRQRGGFILRIEREGVHAYNRHASETALDDYDFDVIVPNNESIADLYSNVDQIVKLLS